MDNVAMLQRIWAPLERGESGDMQPFFDSLDDAVVFEASVGELRGKPAVMHYFTHAGELVDARPFERPLEYLGDGDRVVILGTETFVVKETGMTAHADWAWVHDIRNGKVTRIVSIQDLSAVAETIREAIARAQRLETAA
ncbi:MAG: nuclear transport factor 2 family protein [Natronosporangium sp.]